jgi:hypothetical protein
MQTYNGTNETSRGRTQHKYPFTAEHQQHSIVHRCTRGKIQIRTSLCRQGVGPSATRELQGQQAGVLKSGAIVIRTYILDGGALCTDDGTPGPHQGRPGDGRGTGPWTGHHSGTAGKKRSLHLDSHHIARKSSRTSSGS